VAISPAARSSKPNGVCHSKSQTKTHSAAARTTDRLSEVAVNLTPSASTACICGRCAAALNSRFSCCAQARRRLDADNGKLPEVYERLGSLAARDKTNPITAPVSLVEAVMELGRRHRRGALQGPQRDEPRAVVGNDLDPEARSLVQVKIRHADSAEETFSTLIGDLVEPR